MKATAAKFTQASATKSLENASAWPVGQSARTRW